MRRIFTLAGIVAFYITSCTTTTKEKNEKIFESIDPEVSGVTFSNNITVNDSVNFFKYGYLYMGGGVSTGDINNDGLVDIYFTGNQVSNKLYLNKGNLQFEDITEQSGVGADDRWITGVSMHDVNADGWLDMYVSVSGIWTSTKNILYINQGLNEKGIPTFKDEAELRGVADEGKSIQTCFFDYDQDGDIDIYVANYEKMSFGSFIAEYKQKVDNPVLETSDHLWVNDGNGYFTDGTVDAGLLNFGLAVGVIATDFNNDNLTDLYVSNDFNTPDNFYFNNGDGTFTDLIKETTQHTAFYGMGVDAADINNDGLMDIVQVDMTPADNFRSKANMASMNIPDFWKNIAAGFHYQYMYNTLQVNQGIRPNGEPFFADVAKMSAIDKTDWSWAALFADFDNDGFNDLYVTNGTRRDINNKDFFNWLDRLDIKMKVKYEELTFNDLTEKLPSKKVDNYMFKNTDGKSFEKSNAAWGIEYEGFSNGAAYADLDNDGDLEIIVNNIDSTASIFKNNSIENAHGNFLKIKLVGSDQNPLGLGAKVRVKVGDQIFLKEQTLVRGYQSSIDPILHFGLGNAMKVDAVEVIWPKGKTSQHMEVASNQQISIAIVDSQPSQKAEEQSNPAFEEMSIDGLNVYEHIENDFDDYEHQILLPHMMSRLGPALAKADVNGDGLEDLFIGGAAGQLAEFFYQRVDGSFERKPFQSSEAVYEDVSATFFDADSDGDQDLYVVSGGNDFENGSEFYQDRLYLNVQGVMTRSDVIPDFLISGSVAVAEDYDGDGDLDLFVGGRQSPRSYPLPVSSILLENKSEKGEVRFEISSQEAFENLGMVTSAVWIDLNQDGIQELIVVGEWMPITVFEQSSGEFTNVTADYQLENTVGWWNTIQKADFDQDGDDDLVAGNLGLNYKYKAKPEKTFDVYANDYDENGNLDIVLGYYQDDQQFPVRGLSCSSAQIPEIKKKFKNKYNVFAEATLSDIYGDQNLGEGIHYKAQEFASVYIENIGESQLEMTRLPFAAQTSSLNSMAIMDYNQDGNLDIVAGGNNFTSEVETPRNDACYGWLLQGNGQGQFTTIDYARSGFYVPFDIRHVMNIQTNDGNITLFVSNSGPLKAFRQVK
ncbi:MAG: VCBS repeat-containing protein [Reichenbachiella sp.]|uniref:VCBS repeat-containing protein n=1 Tax=Reichenbachiella sp. TaxID=2184521 RepID=UPI0032990CEC